MLRVVFVVSFLLLLSSVSALKMNFHSFNLKDMNGVDVSLSKYSGKAVLLLNVASL